MRDDQIRMLWTARIDYAAGSAVETHAHDDYAQLLVVLSGSGEIEICDSRREASAGSAYLFLPGAPHRFRFAADTITVDFKFRIADALERALRGASAFRRCTNEELADLKRCHRWSIASRRSGEPYAALRIEATFKGALASMFLIGALGPAPALEPYAELDDNPYAKYMRDRLEEKLTLEQVAGHFGFHPNYFIQLFRERTGMTPIQFLQEARLEKARSYLEFTSMPISEVAEKVGWTLPYFSKLVKQRFGLPPSAYRDSLIGSVGEDIVLESDFRNEWRITSDR